MLRLFFLLVALFVTPALAQTNPGTSPLSGKKGGTNNSFMQFSGPATSMKTFTLPNASDTLAALGQIQTWTGAQSFSDGKLILLGSSSGSSTLKAPATGGGTAILFPGSDTVVGQAATQALTNKTFNCSSNTCTIQTSTLIGTLLAAQEPAHTGDCTNSSGSLALTCLNTNGVAFTATATAAAGQLPAEPSNGGASAGKVGEYIESPIAVGSAVSLVNVTGKDITTIALTAGDWDVSGEISYQTATTTAMTSAFASISLSANTVDATIGRYSGNFFASVTPGASNTAMNVPVGPVRFSLSGTTTVHLVALSSFATAALNGYGIIRARRVR